MIKARPISGFLKSKYLALAGIVVLLAGAAFFVNYKASADTNPTVYDNAMIATLKAQNVQYYAQKAVLDTSGVANNGSLTSEKVLAALSADKTTDPSTIGTERGEYVRLLQAKEFNSIAQAKREEIVQFALGWQIALLNTNNALIAHIQRSDGIAAPSVEDKLSEQDGDIALHYADNIDDPNLVYPAASGAVEYDANGGPVKITLPTASKETVTVKVPVADLAALTTRAATIVSVLETNKVAHEIAQNPDIYYANTTTASTSGKTIEDPYRTLITSKNATTGTIAQAEEMIAYYRKIQDDINAANQNLYTIVKPVDATAYDKLTNTNQTALATVIDKGRFWVATKSILEAKQASSVSDTVDKNLINKIANLSEYGGTSTKSAYVTAAATTGSVLPLSSLTDGIITAAVTSFPVPTAVKTDSTIEKTAATAATTEEVESRATAASLMASATKYIGQFGTTDDLKTSLPTFNPNLLSDKIGFADVFTKYFATLPKDDFLPRTLAVKVILGTAVENGFVNLEDLPTNVDLRQFNLGTSTGISLLPAYHARSLEDIVDGNFADALTDDMTSNAANPGYMVIAGKAVRAAIGNSGTITPKAVVANKGVQQQMKYSNMSSIGINPSTGKVEYTTRVLDSNNVQVGWMSFDPISQKYSSDITTQYAGKFVRFYSAPRTGDTYVMVSNSANPQAPDAKALLRAGKLLEVTAVSVASDGSVGGTIKLFNRYFNYNPVTKAFEVKIRSLVGENSSLASKLPTGLDLTLDSRGTLTGSYSLLGGNVDGKTGKLDSKSQMGLFFDSDGNLGATYVIRNSKEANSDVLGGISIDIKGNIGGAVNIGKILSASGPNVFVSFDKSGISGVNAGVGSIKILGNSTQLGVGINKNGGISIGVSPFMLAGIPLPIGVALGQDAHGNFRITLPIGSIGLGGSEDRDLTAPEIQKDDSGNAKLECIFYYHSFKKMFQTVRVWNTDPDNKCPLQIESAEQVARSNKIFYVFNRLYGRNPSYTEFYTWYFYSAGDLANAKSYLYAFEYGKDGNSDYRTTKLEAQMRSHMTETSEYKYRNAIAQGSTSVTKPSDIPADADIMPYNPFDPDQVAKYAAEQTAAASSSTSTTTGSSGTTSLSTFFDAVSNAASSDPYYKNGEYITTNSATSGIYDSTTTTSSSELTDEEKQAAEDNKIATEEDFVEDTLTIEPGFNTVYVPRDRIGWDVSAFTDKGLVVYDFNSDGSKTWKLSSKNEIPYMKPGIGYYVYNSTDDNISVLTSAAGVNKVRTLNSGWNLLANSTGLYAKLSDLLYRVAKPDQPTCTEFNCTMSVSLLEYFNKTIEKNLAYKNVFIIKNANGKTSGEAFTTQEINSGNAESIVFSPGEVFWLYKW